MLKIHNGNEYPVKIVRSGISGKGEWMMAIIKESEGKGRQEAPLFILNREDCGLTPKVDDGCTIRVDSFGVERDDSEGGTIRPEEYPKGSGKWRTTVAFDNCIVHKVGEAMDSFEGEFRQGTFEDYTDDGGELPF